MLEFVLIKDKNDWENVLSIYPEQSTSINSYEWKEFRQSIGNKVEYYKILENSKYIKNAKDTVAPKIIGGLCLEYVNAKRGNYINLRHNPLINLDNGTETKQLILEIISFLKQICKKNDCCLFRINPHILYTKLNISFEEEGSNINNLKTANISESNEDLLLELGFKKSYSHVIDGALTTQIDLQKSIDEIYANMHKNTRNRINQAIKRYNIKIEVSKNYNEDKINFEHFFKEFLDIYKQTVNLKQWVAFSENYLKKQFEIFSKNNMLKIFLAKYEEKYVSAMVMIFYKDKACHLYSGTRSEFRNIPSAYLLNFETIKYSKENGFKLYDLFGIGPKDNTKHPLYGVTSFKLGFGGQIVEYMPSYNYIVNLKGYLLHYYEFIENKMKGY